MRAQAHTLEAFVAAIVLLASVAFSLQVTAVTPLTASTSSQHIENQQGAVGAGTLITAHENGTLRPTLLFVNNSTGQFHETSERGRYPMGGPPTPFGRTLNRTYLDRGIAVNVNVHWTTSSGQRRSQAVVHTGVPSDNSVSTSYAVTLTDDDSLYDPGPDGSVVETNRTLGAVAAAENETFYAPDAHEGVLYNVVDVEVVAWRM